MISSAPAVVKNNFTDELKKIVDENKFLSVKRYYDSLRPKTETYMDKLLGKNCYRNMDGRVLTSRYFYFPTESDSRDMNCLEKSASIYFALLEVYPESNPALMYVFSKNGSIHATTLFTHLGELYAGDPNYGLFDKVILNSDSIVSQNKEGIERKFEFVDIFRVGDNTLDRMARKLRSDSGIVDFIYKSGQIAAINDDLSVGSYLFMRANENNTITSEIRLGKKGIRQNYTLGVKKGKLEAFKCDNFLWTGTIGEARLQIPTDNPFLDTTREELTKNSYSLEQTSYYLDRIMSKPFSFHEIMQFVDHPKVRKRFDKVLDLAKSYDAALYFNFANYLRTRFGSAEHMVALTDEIDIGLIKDGKEHNLKMPTFASSFETMYLKEVMSHIRFSLDSKRYAKEIVKHL